MALGPVMGGAASAATASVVSQGVGVATGIQDKFSWKGVGLAALGGAVGGALGEGGLFKGDGLFGGGTLAPAGRGAVGSAIGQGIGVATGLQSKFDFAGVAAAGIGAGAGGAIGGAAARAGAGRFGASLIANIASGIANAATRSAITGNSFGDNIIRALPDIIGNTVGGLVADAVAGANTKVLRQGRIAANMEGIQQLLGPDADVSGLSVAMQALAENPSNDAAKDNAEYEVRRLLIANRGNAAVEDLINEIGYKLPQGYLASPDDIFVLGERDYLIGSLIDNSGIWLGEKQKQIGTAVGGFLEEHPGAALAARLFDTGVTAVGGPLRYVAGQLLDYTKDSISGWVADKMTGPKLWTAEKGQAGGDGAVFAASIAISGLGALKGAESAVPNGKFYSVAFETKLNPTSYPGVSRGRHFQESNEAFLRAMEGDAAFAKSMGDMGINIQRTPKGLAPRTSPDNWTWHHAQEPGVMQLVPRTQHQPGSIFQDAFHPDGKGGYSIWGK